MKMKMNQKLRPLDGLYAHPDVSINPTMESQHINNSMKKFSSKDSHVEVKSWTRKIIAAPYVSDKLLERVTCESKKQIIGVPKVYLGDATVLQGSVGDHSEPGSSKTSNISCASVCPISHFADVHTLDSTKSLGTFEGQQPPQNMDTFQTTVDYEDQNVSDFQCDDSSCISKDNGENMTSNDCIGATDLKNVMPSVKISGSSAPSEVSSFRNEPAGAKSLVPGCAKEPGKRDVSMKLEVGNSYANSSATGSLKGCDENEHLKYNPPLKNMQNTGEPSVQGHSLGNNEVTDVLVDVRVCDICGDVGREGLLALCSKCSDGAEHIYCMRIKMDTVPIGTWMCEECSGMEEPMGQKLVEANRLDCPSNSHLEEASRNFMKKDSHVQHAGELKTKSSRKRPGSDIEVGRVPKRRIFEGSAQSVKSSGCLGETRLSRISSIKNMNKGKYEALQVSSLSGQNSKKVMDEVCSPRGHRSLKHCSVGEVKTAKKSSNLEKSDHPLNSMLAREKLQFTRVSSMKIGDKGNKVAGHGCSLDQQSAKEVVAKQLYSPRGYGSPRLQQQFRGGKLRKSKSMSIPDSDKEIRCRSKDIHLDGSAKESSYSPLNKNCPERKLLKSMSFSGVKSVSPYVSNAHFSHTKQDLRHRNGRNSTKKIDSAAVKNPRFGLHFSAPGGMKVNTHRTKVGCDSHLLKNNVQEMKAIRENEKSNLSKVESGKTIVKPRGSIAYQEQFCSNTSVARSVGETAPPTCRIRSPAKNLSPFPDPKSNQSPQKPDIECLLGVDKGHLVASNKAPQIHFHPMKETNTFTPMVSCGISAVPESEFIWKGTFELDKGCKLPNKCIGIQAHLSTCASSKVANLAHKFCPKLLLKEVSRSDTWPIQFQRKLPTEEDIGIYFFAENLESYSRSYKMVLEGMIENDLALEADFDGVQLLVFPSSLLPFRSQRWNTLSFLWGVFRVRKIDNVIVQNPSYIPKLNQGPGSVVPLEKCLSSQGAENVRCEADSVPLAHYLTEKEKLRGSVFCDDDNEKDDEYANEELKSLSKPCGVPREQTDGEVGGNIAYLAVDPDAGYKAPSLTWQEEKMAVAVSGSSFSVDSGPSGSSDGAGCTKLDEGQVEQSHNPKYDLNLNLDLSFGSRLEREEEIETDLNLDLVLGFPQKNKYQPERCPKDSDEDNNNNLLVLSLGMPCSTFAR